MPKHNVSPYLYVGYYCNNNCIFCSEADEYLETLKEKTLTEIKEELKEIRKHYDFVNIMGREPTIRLDILAIIKYAQNLKFKQIGITTNGRLLSINTFTKALIESGINQIGISLCGASPEVHDKQTRVKGSFEQTINGIKNVLKYKPKNLSLLINLPLNRLNYKNFKKEMQLLTSLGIKEINILNIEPLSRRSRSKDIIMPTHTLANHVIKVLSSNHYLEHKDLKILLVEFPPCSLPKLYRQYFFPCLERNTNKIKIPICTKCQYTDICDGILKDYISLYGIKEFKI